ncbi:hypothetical protein AHAS_Ahas17G0108500 [Arachis hypogaea]
MAVHPPTFVVRISYSESRAAATTSHPHARNRAVRSSPQTVTVPPSHPRASNRRGQKFAPDRCNSSVLPTREQPRGIRSSPETAATAACRRRRAIEASSSQPVYSTLPPVFCPHEHHVELLQVAL